MDSTSFSLCILLSSALSLLLLLIFFHHLRSSRRNLRLPPGTLGLPLLGETLQLISAYKSENPEPFIDERVARFGPLFTTHVFGEPTVFSADPDTNRFILQNEGKLFESSYPASISNLLGKHSLLLMKGSLQKRMHSLTTSFANSSVIRVHLLLDVDRLVRLNLHSWTGRRILLMEEAKKVKSTNQARVNSVLIPCGASLTRHENYKSAHVSSGSPPYLVGVSQCRVAMAVCLS